MLRRIFTMTLILSSTVLALAQSNTGMMAGSFERMGVSARTKSMGNAGTAIASGYSTAYDNPAFLPMTLDKRVGLTMHRLALDRQFTHIGFVSPLKGDAGVSVWWLNAGVKDIDGRDLDGNQMQSMSYFDNAFALGFAISPVPKKVSIGINFKVFYGLFPRIKDDGKAIKGTGMGFDVGGRVALPYHLTAAVMIRDLGAKYTWNTDGYWSQGTSKIDKYPVQTRLGLAYNKDNLLATVDGEFATGKQKLRVGAEYQFEQVEDIGFALRGGMDGTSPTFGLGLKWAILGFPTQMDYAYVLESIAPNDTHVLSWMVGF